MGCACVASDSEMGWLIVLYFLGGVGFIVFFFIALIELRRTPSDLSEAESELVARHGLDYDGFCFTVLFLGEYIRFYWIFGVMVFMFNWGFRIVFGVHFMLIAIRAVLR